MAEPSSICRIRVIGDRWLDHQCYRPAASTIKDSHLTQARYSVSASTLLSARDKLVFQQVGHRIRSGFVTFASRAQHNMLRLDIRQSLLSQQRIQRVGSAGRGVPFFHRQTLSLDPGAYNPQAIPSKQSPPIWFRSAQTAYIQITDATFLCVAFYRSNQHFS